MRKARNSAFLVRSVAVGVASILFGLASDAKAVAPHRSTRGPATEIAAGPAPRHSRALAPRPPSAAAERAWQRFRGAHGQALAAWDPATGAAAFLAPAAIDAPGAVADGKVARQLARALLVEHQDLLAPGCSADDFVVVGDDLSHGIRTIGLQQRSRGLEVIGGQVSFRFKHDRLIGAASQALPCAALPPPVAAGPDEVARARALAWIAADGPIKVTAIGEVGPPQILARVGARGVLQADVVREVIVATEGPIGRWRVHVDAQSGEPIAREQLLRFAVDVRYNAPRRQPSAARYDAPAALTNFVVGGVQQVSDATGSLPIDAPVAITTTTSGPFVTVLNAEGSATTVDWVVGPGDTLVWNQAFDETVDAQLSASIHTNLVKDYVRKIGADVPWLDGQIQVTVNIPDICNAFSDGDTINFFLSGAGCENTARLADVVYHEFGHSIHFQSLIPGVGAFHPSLSEGISDYLSATIVNDASLAPGFFSDSPDEPLRELDPEGYEWHWPEDQGEVHDEGRIIGGALWDLRKILRGKLGTAAGTARADLIWYESIRRAIDIPSMYPEALVVDDDDGDLTNGTPNGCEIAAAFGAHGLRTLGGGGAAVEAGPEGLYGYPVSVAVQDMLAQCPGGGSHGAVLEWRLRDNPGVGGESAMAPTEQGFLAYIPHQPDGHVVQYQIRLKTSQSAEEILPKNPADPWYEFYVGPVEPLYCTDFESNPFVEGWTTFGFNDDWLWGPPSGGGLDPALAYSGLSILGEGFFDGLYGPFTDSAVLTPPISTAGYSEVRLQYRRWLSVEDGFFDQAWISANDASLWSNQSGEWEGDASTHHIDGEWRFHDVDLSDYVGGGQVNVGFHLHSDGGLELGGWNLDALCVVGVPAAPAPLPYCGNGLVEGLELCDDGNNASGDGCSATCTVEAPSETDTDTDTDTDTETDTDDSATTGGLEDLRERGCACGVGDAPLAGVWALALLALPRRRRRR